MASTNQRNQCSTVLARRLMVTTVFAASPFEERFEVERTERHAALTSPGKMPARSIIDRNVQSINCSYVVALSDTGLGRGTRRVSKIPNSYSRYMGSARSIKLYGSPVGVINAAMMVMMTMA